MTNFERIVGCKTPEELGRLLVDDMNMVSCSCEFCKAFDICMVDDSGRCFKNVAIWLELELSE